jgi:hypothetical protein
MQPPSLSVRRPVVPKTGPKRLLGFVAAKKDGATAGSAGSLSNGEGPAAAAGGGTSNADFKKLFLASGSSGQPAEAGGTADGEKAS